MNVFLTFDIEVWCNGWDDLDESFPSCFERYVYGHSAHGDYALPQTLAILNRHELKGVFFVEPLFAARFGAEHLAKIVRMIRIAGQEVQLHLHPEWTDEAHTPLIENCATKRQHLTHYSVDEQSALIAYGKEQLEAAGSGPITAFRSGSFAANLETFEALRRNAIWLDTSLNRCFDISGPDIRLEHALNEPFELDGIRSFPVTVLRDGFGRDRPAQVGACGAREMCEALTSAQKMGLGDFVIVSHNFEMLKAGSCLPDWIVVRRFEKLCAFLAENSDKFTVTGFRGDRHIATADEGLPHQPHASWQSTSLRHLEQIRRRLSL